MRSARASGFSDPGYFIKVVRRRYGATPGRYVQRMSGGKVMTADR